MPEEGVCCKIIFLRSLMIRSSKMKCDSTWEKGPSRALFQNRVIATAGKSRLLATKCATYLVMKAKCSRVIAISVHSFLSTAIS